MTERDLLDPEDDEEDTQGQPENEPLPISAKEVEELRQYRDKTETDKHEAAVAAAFEDEGLSAKIAKLFITLDPDAEATPEAIRAFQKEFDIPDAKPRGFTPTAIPSSDRVSAVRMWTKAEFEEGMRVNPGLWQARFEQGKVKLNNPQVLERRMIR